MTTIRALIERHPVLIYYTLVFSLSWGAVITVLGGVPGPETQSEVLLPMALLAMLVGPAMAGTLLTGIVYGRAGLRELVSRLLTWRVGARWYAVALLIAPLSAIASLLALSFFFPEFTPDIVTSENAVTVRYSVLATGLIVGVMWGVWHLFAYYWGSGTPTGTLNLGLFLPGVLHSLAVLPAFRVLIVWMYDRTGSLLVAMLMHASLSTSNLLFNPEPGIRLLGFHLGVAVVLWAVVVVVYVASGWQVERRTP